MHHKLRKVLSSSTNIAKVWHSDNPIEVKYNFSVLSLLIILFKNFTKLCNQLPYIATAVHVLTIKLYIHSYAQNRQFALFLPTRGLYLAHVPMVLTS